MELLDRYLAAVAAELPAARAHEIVRELRANLLDLLDAEQATLGRPLQTAELAGFLQQQGHPELVAQRYAPSAPLIAGEDMPLYCTVLRYGAALVAVLVLLKSLGLLIDADSVSPVRLLMQLGFGFIDAFSGFLLWVTVLFYLASRAGWTGSWRQRSWQVADLPRYPQARISLADVISDLTSTTFLLLLLWTPLWMSSAAQQNLPLTLSGQMEHWRWVLTVMCLCSVLFALYRLLVRCWQRWNLALYVLEHVTFAAVFLLMALQPDQVLIVSTTANGWFWPHVIAGMDTTLLFTALVLLVMAALQLRRWQRL